MMSDNRETNDLLREIRDSLADREQQYAQHLEQIRKLYMEQNAFARQEQERAIRRVAILVGVLGGVLFLAFKWL